MKVSSLVFVPVDCTPSLCLNSSLTISLVLIYYMHNDTLSTTGTKKVLVVRVTDKEGKAPAEDASFLSDKFFGTNGDTMTMTSQFDACSFGEFLVTTDYGNAAIEAKMAAPGVLEIDINIKLKDATQAQVRSACLNAIKNKLGVNMPWQFDHVVLVVEDCYPNGTSCGFAAYAYVNHWLSLFIEDNYIFPAVQMVRYFCMYYVCI